MTKLQKKNKQTSLAATILGVSVAIANAWITIDWNNFNINTEYPKLLLSAVIAYGGYKSRIKTNTDDIEQ